MFGRVHVAHHSLATPLPTAGETRSVCQAEAGGWVEVADSPKTVFESWSAVEQRKQTKPSSSLRRALRFHLSSLCSNFPTLPTPLLTFPDAGLFAANY